MSTTLRLGEAFTIPDVVSASDFVLQINAGVERAADTVSEYVVTPALAEAFDAALAQMGAALAKGTSQGAFIHGSFGSGKSHFMAVLDLILRGFPQARALPGLQAAISDHQDVMSRRLLTVEYHLIGATSFEDALFSGYLHTIAREHPQSRTPILHKSDALLHDAAATMAAGPEVFFARLNGGTDDEWGEFAGGWDAATFAAAVAAPVGDPERDRLVDDLVETMYSGYVSAGEWLSLPEGLSAMAAHARELGYDGLVLFLDELVLWLASHLPNMSFISSEGAKVAKLVEEGGSGRAIPIISFVARQRELQDFLGDDAAGVSGAQRMAVGETFRWWEDRFDRITLPNGDLPKIANRRLLQPATPEAAAAIGKAVAAVRDNREAWDVLLTSETAAGASEFADVYPFSPALVDTLVVLAPMMQRERTALKVMAQLLVNGRDEVVIDDIIPAGDLYDVVVTEGSTPLSTEIKAHFAIARDLYDAKLRPMLLDEHSLTESQAQSVTRDHPFSRDDRLLKTLLIAALAPGVRVLANLTAARLAALNHGTVRSRFPGNEAAIVLGKVRGWAKTVGEITIGEGDNPIISLNLSGVDYDSILERVATEDNEGARRTLLRAMLFDQLGLKQDTNLYGAASLPLVWRGSKRMIDVVFGNIRDTAEFPDNTFVAQADTWRLVLDFPFDTGAHSPHDDLTRLERLAGELATRTVAWVPSFFTSAMSDELGRLVRLEYLLGGSGTHFDEHSAQLPPEQRPIAKEQLANLRAALRGRVNDVLKQAYGVAKRNPTDIDTSYGEVQPFFSLETDFTPQPPIGADLGQAMANLAGQMLAHQFPDHPRFEPSTSEVTRANLNVVLEHVAKAMESGGRVSPVEQTKRAALTRVANPLHCGQFYENHYVFEAGTFPWRNTFVRAAALDGLVGEVPVRRVREWLAPYGLSKPLQNLLVVAWALLDDKEFSLHGTPVTVTGIDQVRDDYVLRDPVLPAEQAWTLAVTRAFGVFGETVSDLRTAANVRRLAAGVRARASAWKDDATALRELLHRHSATLGLTEASPRMRDARLGAELVARLAGERDDLVLVNALADAPVPAEPQSLAKSLGSARSVVAAIKGASWDGLRAVATLDDDRAVAIMAPLRTVADASELHKNLEPSLRKASGEAGQLITDLLGANVIAPLGGEEPDGDGGRGSNAGPEQPNDDSAAPSDQGDLPTTPSSTTATRVRLDAIELDDLKSQLSLLEQAISRKMSERQHGRIHIEWWVE